MGHPGLFSVDLQSCSNKHYKFLQKINVQNVQPVYSAGIRTHDFQIVCLIS